MAKVKRWLEIEYDDKEGPSFFTIIETMEKVAEELGVEYNSLVLNEAYFIQNFVKELDELFKNFIEKKMEG